MKSGHFYGISNILHSAHKLNVPNSQECINFAQIKCQQYFQKLGFGILISQGKGLDVRGARYITDFDGRFIFCTIFHENSKNIIFSRLDTPNRRTSSALVACSRAGTWAAWAEVVRQLGVSNLEKKYTFGILMKNGTKYQSASSIGRIFF